MSVMILLLGVQTQEVFLLHRLLGREWTRRIEADLKPLLMEPTTDDGFFNGWSMKRLSIQELLRKVTPTILISQANEIFDELIKIR